MGDAHDGAHAHRTPPRLGAVLLAAGQGARIGGRPKALLEIGGVPLIVHQLTALSGAGADELVVVLGHHAAQIDAVVAQWPVKRVHNPRPDQGQVSSQRLGLRALSDNVDAVLVALADQPLIDEHDIRALLAAYARRPAGAEVVVPKVDGQPGNPVIFTASVRQQILAGGAAFGCRDWRAEHPDRVVPLTTDNRHYRLDIDTVEDIVRFERDTGHTLRWPA